MFVAFFTSLLLPFLAVFTASFPSGKQISELATGDHAFGVTHTLTLLDGKLPSLEADGYLDFELRLGWPRTVAAQLEAGRCDAVVER